eukprot:TRINITY_DN12078_c0_g1_i1.p1 TRINITY_DN12078_c0_g1~~TRINITY_DN12078_c0_g1_i1.p1  ORF type:complete len:352 (-),score=85.33 TRINITY_DN12078_c0_g1_i1:19-1074(-)
MSCCSTPEDNRLNAQLQTWNKNWTKRAKLLLLGPGESGKSTFAKQVRCLQASDFNKQEKADFLLIIRQNVLEGMKQLVLGADMLGFEVSDDIEDHVDRIMEMEGFDINHDDGVPDTFEEDVWSIWVDEGIQQAFARRNEFYFLESVGIYYLRKRKYLQRLCSSDYVPTQTDIMYARSKTTGISELQFSIDGNEFLIVDVGGQRTERKKWIHCFDTVTAVLFMVGTSEYDQNLYEQADVNRMDEALQLWKDVIDCVFFDNVAYFLILNKMDLFEEKIKTVDLNVCPAFHDYKGGNDKAKAIDYIREKFRSMVEPGKTLYIQTSTATDSRLIEELWLMVSRVTLQGIVDNIFT